MKRNTTGRTSATEFPALNALKCGASDQETRRPAHTDESVQELIVRIVRDAKGPMSEFDIVAGLRGSIEPSVVQFRIARMVRERVLIRFYDPLAGKPLFVEGARPRG